MFDAEDTLKGKYPAKEHAKNVVKYIAENGGDITGLIYVESQKTRLTEDNDEPMPFRQRRYFFYLTGCELPDSYLTYDMATEKSTLFIPPIDPEEVIWSGLPMTPEEALKKYDVDAVLSIPELNPHLASHKSAVYAIAHQVADSTSFLNATSTDFTLLKPAIEQCRVIKTPYEVALIRHANFVSTLAHTAVMRSACRATNERELEALFISTSIAHGCREQAYHSIVASGTAAATLHYVKNDAPLAEKLNILLDAGAESRCYASDITRTFPISGAWTPESRAIYELVLHMQSECMGMLRAGVEWEGVHERAHWIAIEGLLNLGILRGNKEEIFRRRVSVAFFPHGLGHYLGMDTHDTGGHANYADKDPMFRYLRVRGRLPAGSVITVEPGLYFCTFIIEPYLHNEETRDFIDAGILERYWDVGGVRIEDDVLITEDGYENLTTTPKDVKEMEQIVRQGQMV